MCTKQELGISEGFFSKCVMSTPSLLYVSTNPPAGYVCVKRANVLKNRIILNILPCLISYRACNNAR